MVRIQIWTEGRWVWGLHDYTPAQAQERMKRLKAVGIKARIRPLSELLGG